MLSNPDVSDADIVEQAWLKLDAIQEAVELARAYCRVQKDALLHKLSRAYQKPDFCIWRGITGAHRDNLLPVTLSWDDEWYFGKKINLSDSAEAE